MVLRQVQPREYAAKEIAGEFLASFKLLVLEHIREVPVLEVAKQRIDQSLPDQRLQLVEELRILYLIVVILVTLVRVLLYAVAQDLAQILAP